MQRDKLVIGTAIFIAGLCSIIYELLISTTSAYFLGDSVQQFSLTIGIYMAAMGLGAYFSKFLGNRLFDWFVLVEVLLGLVGGAAVLLLYLAFDGLTVVGFQIFTQVLTGVVGLLTGFELPLLSRIMKTYYPLRSNLANVLSLDYFGALGATLLFPFLLLPFYGLFRTSVFFGMLNILLGLGIAYAFASHLGRRFRRRILVAGLLCLVFFVGLLLGARSLLLFFENKAYSHRVIYSEQTPYQRLAITKNRAETRLYINRVIQFSSRDEYRYHEALALIPAGYCPSLRRVLILGGGEGLLAREVLRWPNLEQLTIIDLDPAVFKLGRTFPALVELNEGALDDERVQLVAEDAGRFLRSDTGQYDLILADLPDPTTEGVSRLYSTYIYRMVHERLRPDGLFATQATSPFYTRAAFWSIAASLEAVFDWVRPFHVYVPSFGDWGFVLAGTAAPANWQLPATIQPRFIEANQLPRYFHFPPDQRAPEGIQPNTLDRPVLLDYYLKDWRRLQRESNVVME